MKIEICNTLSLLLKSSDLSPQARETIWQERIVASFKPMLQMLHMDFSAMGACDLSTSSDETETALDVLKKHQIVERIQTALEKAFRILQKHGDFPFPETLKVGVFVSNGKNVFHEKLNHGFSGFGGIPGFIVLILSPTEYVLKNIEALVVHEFHHNIRNAIEPWPKDMNISVGEYLLVEGMAEAFAAELYGEESVGPQTIGLVGAELEKAKQTILPHIEERGFQTAQSYLFGDAFADTFGYPKRGLPHGSGYAVGYRLVKDYLAKTGKNIFAATQESSEQILNEMAPPVQKSPSSISISDSDSFSICKSQ